MSYFDYSLEPENHESKCLCVLVLDTSSSMGDPNFSPTPIEELNESVKDFYKDIISDFTTSQRLELAIISFNNKITLLREPNLIENYDMKPLKTSGTTKMVDAVNEAINITEHRKKWYRDTNQPYYRPWIILITDGSPDEDQDIEGLSKKINEFTKEKKFIFYALGINEADMNILNKISSAEFPPSKLAGLRFREFFQWLSKSLSLVASSKPIDLENSSNANEDWTMGYEINTEN